MPEPNPPQPRRWQFSVKTLLLATLLLALLLWSGPLVYDWWTAPPTISLTAAVEDFNAKASQDHIGLLEPSLTEAEVIKAIHSQLSSISDSPKAKAIYQRIVRTNRIPTTARLHSIPAYQSGNGPARAVWWINLEISTGRNTGYALRIRENNNPTAAP